MLILIQNWCTVCDERTIASEINLDHPMELIGDVGHVDLTSFRLEAGLVSVQDRCMVCAGRTMRS